jgi:hypothetical protein
MTSFADMHRLLLPQTPTWLNCGLARVSVWRSAGQVQVQERQIEVGSSVVE